MVALLFFEYSPHECLANKTASVGDSITVTEAIQRTLLTIVEQNCDFMFARGFTHGDVKIFS